MAKIMLCANDKVGVEVAKFLKEENDIIEFLLLHDKEENQKKIGDIIKFAKPKRIFLANQMYNENVIKEIKSCNIDFIITVYWAYLLKPEIIALAKNTLNFHPALLPINRGWFPHVHSFIEGTPFGVTLHQIDEGADTGPIWVQKEVFPDEIDTSGSMYKKLQNEIIDLFKENWKKIKTGKIKPFPQDEKKAIYKSKKEIEKLDFIDINQTMNIKDFIQLLKSRTFENKGFAYYCDKNGRKIYLHLRLSYESNF